MKKEYASSILSLIVLLLGLTACISFLFLPSLSVSSKSILVLFGICLITIGSTSYSIHNKKYFKIKHLKNNDVPILAHWKYKPESSHTISEFIKERKTSAIYTTILTLLLFLVIAFIIYLTKEKYSNFIGLTLTLLSLLSTIAVFMYLPYYYKNKILNSSEALIGEDCILFLDEFFGLQRSVYFLEDVQIHYGVENILQFSYGTYDIVNGSVFSIDIPIPENQLEIAKRIQNHYLDLINFE